MMTFKSIKLLFQGYFKLKEIYPILKALLKFFSTKNLFKNVIKSIWKNAS